MQLITQCLILTLLGDGLLSGQLNGLHKSHVSLSVDSLAKKGIIVKVQDEQDKKIWHLLLTEKAGPVAERVFLREKEMEEIFFRGLSEEEKELFQKLTEKIVSNATENFLLKQRGG